MNRLRIDVSSTAFVTSAHGTPGRPSTLRHIASSIEQIHKTEKSHLRAKLEKSVSTSVCSALKFSVYLESSREGQIAVIVRPGQLRLTNVFPRAAPQIEAFRRCRSHQNKPFRAQCCIDLEARLPFLTRSKPTGGQRSFFAFFHNSMIPPACLRSIANISWTRWKTLGWILISKTLHHFICLFISSQTPVRFFSSYLVASRRTAKYFSFT